MVVHPLHRQVSLLINPRRGMIEVRTDVQGGSVDCMKLLATSWVVKPVSNCIHVYPYSHVMVGTLYQ